MTSLDLQGWLRARCQEYEYDLRGVFRVAGSTQWPLTAADASDLETQLQGVQEPWRIGSRQRSSTTREYIGAVLGLDNLRHGRGEFKTEAEFYKFWRAYNFRIGGTVRNQLNRLLAQQEQASRDRDR